MNEIRLTLLNSSIDFSYKNNHTYEILPSPTLYLVIKLLF